MAASSAGSGQSGPWAKRSSARGWRPFSRAAEAQVLHLRQGGGGVDGLGELFGEPALLVDGFFHRLPPLLEAPEVLEPLLQIAEGGVVHGSVVLLAVAGDEGDGVALVQKLDDIGDILRVLVQLLGQLGDDGFHITSFDVRVSPGGRRFLPPPTAWSCGGR